MKFKTTNYGNRKEILKFPDHYVNIAITVSDSGISANGEGRKVVPAGTILGGGVLANETTPAVKATTGEDGSNAEGILFFDVDVTDGPAKGAMLIHGFVDTSKLPVAPTDEDKAVLKQITFVE